MEIIDLNSDIEKKISLVQNEEKFFVWLLGSGGNFDGNFVFDLDAEARLTNIFLFSANDADDFRVNISVRHLGENSFSNTFIYGLGCGAAKSSVLAKARIDKGAKHSSAWIEGRALLFGDSQCRIDPLLEVETSEVERAGHAAAVSKVSDEELFYMASRGVAKLEAEKLKSEGFLFSPLLKSGVGFKEAREIVKSLII
ncbi:MAG: hypothetical protein A2931_00505 [Candidatus Niyogibacteria bacterium RIFCSPLOWO2_01_FULL_45_48]|uniref:SUF system FeS cluster assembly SufBD core domain-containing protein n=2 Tax=Candidatus Niyogiibacteriota TaxID=1817912 RepID=A0A1G2F100_9BACT|nr:MAG: hypothetical protein A2931_00505 [Candidatus Niyogibacteria bacterium RIFCSPLOWO2_01_FULL_45_48]OGZ30333.1 MAG: hypothetical protein A2835_01790 [Candidatus Niyogibacteria bacterium RIFCSPHIGHO2_01_FULL_45_28]OGZ31607.1 MAG: hypothetical protein A3J00_00120 [Candidatus Niyogibacteria bacterium RIFCSPLOWO2_02_FULL_45_13]